MNAPIKLPDVAASPETALRVSLEPRRLQCYIALVVGDIIALVLGFGVGGFLYLKGAGLDQALVLAPLILPAASLVALYNGSYSMAVLRDWRRGALRVAGAVIQASAIVVFIGFYTKSSAQFSRIGFTLGVVIGVLFLVAMRAAMRRFVAWRCGPEVANDLVLLDGGPMIACPGATIVHVDDLHLGAAIENPHALHRLGTLLCNVDRVIVSCPPERREAWTVILKSANVQGDVLDDTVAALSAHGARLEHGHGFLRVSVGPLGYRARVLKRMFDTALAVGALLALTPIMVLVAVAIMVEDGLPVLFGQRRVGRSNRFFRMYKFRSMELSRLDVDGERSAAREDPRITRVGRFIRRTSLDELPQLWNVVTGNMSLVGPRPHAIGSQAGDKLFWEVDARYWQRHALKPGLTGLAQVRGLRGATDEEADLVARLDADLEYIDNWSLWRDIRILLATARVLVHDRAF